MNCTLRAWRAEGSGSSPGPGASKMIYNTRLTSYICTWRACRGDASGSSPGPGAMMPVPLQAKQRTPPEPPHALHISGSP